jgi:hypothetical protein
MSASADLPELLLGLARDDEFAARSLLPVEGVADSILGLHAQQAVEKALKAALASRGVAFPHTHTHDLDGLLERIRGTAVSMARCRGRGSTRGRADPRCGRFRCRRLSRRRPASACTSATRRDRCNRTRPGRCVSVAAPPVGSTDRTAVVDLRDRRPAARRLIAVLLRTSIGNTRDVKDVPRDAFVKMATLRPLPRTLLPDSDGTQNAAFAGTSCRCG